MYYMNVSFFFIENYEETGRRVHCGPLNHFWFFFPWKVLKMLLLRE